MYILTVCLAPESVKHDPNLFGVAIDNTSKETIKEAISSRYILDEKSFRYRDYDDDLPEGSFETIDESVSSEYEGKVRARVKWIFDVFES